MFNFIRNCEIVFQSSRTIWLSHQQCSSCSASSPTFGIDSLLRFSHSSFNLHFPGDWWSWTSFHMLVCHSYVFFGYVSVKIFDLFCFIVLFVFLLWNCKSSLYILDAILLLDTCFTDIFSQSVAYLFPVFCVCVCVCVCGFHIFIWCHRGGGLSLGSCRVWPGWWSVSTRCRDWVRAES